MKLNMKEICRFMRKKDNIVKCGSPPPPVQTMRGSEESLNALHLKHTANNEEEVFPSFRLVLASLSANISLPKQICLYVKN